MATGLIGKRGALNCRETLNGSRALAGNVPAIVVAPGRLTADRRTIVGPASCLLVPTAPELTGTLTGALAVNNWDGTGRVSACNGPAPSCLAGPSVLIPADPVPSAPVPAAPIPATPVRAAPVPAASMVTAASVPSDPVPVAPVPASITWGVGIGVDGAPDTCRLLNKKSSFSVLKKAKFSCIF